MKLSELFHPKRKEDGTDHFKPIDFPGLQPEIVNSFNHMLTHRYTAAALPPFITYLTVTQSGHCCR